MDNNIKELDLRDWASYAQIRNLVPQLAEMETFPAELFEWNRKSRRVFRLNRNLQYIFAAATFPKITWQDVKWPFDAFAIELEQPLRVEDSNGMWTNYDTLLVSHIPNPQTKLIVVRALREPHLETNGITQDERRMIDAALNRKDYARAKHLCRRAEMRLFKPMHRGKEVHQGTCWWVLYEGLQEPETARLKVEPEDIAGEIASLRQETPQHLDDVWGARNISTMVKLAVGTALYLRSLSAPPIFTKPDLNRAPGTRGVTGIITNPDYLCEVIGKGVVDPATYGLRQPPEDAGRFFVRPHWRRGHDRRPAGSPPNAPKSIEVPPMLIREDLVPLFGIIGGTHTDILPEE